MAANVPVVKVFTVVKVVWKMHIKKTHFLFLLGIYPKEIIRDGHRGLSPRVFILLLNIIITKLDPIYVLSNGKMIKYLQNTELKLRIMFWRTFNNLGKYSVMRKQSKLYIIITRFYLKSIYKYLGKNWKIFY